MTQLTISGKREATGSRANELLRGEGRVPAIVYGAKKDNVMLSLAAKEASKIVAIKANPMEVDIEGSVEKVVVKEIQWDTFGEHMLHIDFLRS